MWSSSESLCTGITSEIQIRMSESLRSESLSPLIAFSFGLLQGRPTFPFRPFPYDLPVDFAPLSACLLNDEIGSERIVRFLDAEFIELLLCDRCVLSAGLREHLLRHEPSLRVGQCDS